MTDKVPQLTQEEITAGVEQFEVPLKDLEAVDISGRNIERMARGFIMGTQAIGRRREVRGILEERVTKRIGRKGKYLVDKLFELIEGVEIIEKMKDGRIDKYYKVAPNLNAIIYALDRVLGKPKQFTEHSEEKRGIILVEHVIKNLAQNPYAKNGVRKDNVGGSGGGNEVGAVAEHGVVVGERQPEGAGAIAL